MCKDQFIVVDATGLDKEEYGTYQDSLARAAEASIYVFHGLMLAAEGDDVVRNWQAPEDYDHAEWTLEARCLRCNRWAEVPAMYGIHIASAHMAKITITNRFGSQMDDISDLILEYKDS